MIRTPGILIVRPKEPLFFANAEQVFQVIRQRAAAVQLRTVVLSLEVCDDLDATATEALAEFAAGLRQEGRQLVLARVRDRVREALLRAGLISANPDQDAGVAVFWSVDDAVQAKCPS